MTPGDPGSPATPGDPKSPATPGDPKRPATPAIPGLTDAHCHLTLAPLSGDVAGVLARAAAAGVDRVLTVSAEAGDAERVVQLAESDPRCWAAIGIHPHEARHWSDEHEAELRRLAENPKVVAIGEIGLDYHHDLSPRPAQQAAFRAQLRLAVDVDLPVVVHSRQAEADTARILLEEGVIEVGGMLHCFSSGWELAEACLDLAFFVSFSGIVTFPRAEDVREAARKVPEDKLLIETDAPYLAPVPHRGPQANEPAHLAVIAARLAELRGTTVEALAAATSDNFGSLFRLPPPT